MKHCWRNAETRARGERIVALRAEHPEWKAREIASQVGTTRQYVSRVLRNANAPTKAVHPPKERAVRTCIRCGAPFHPKGSDIYCTDCATFTTPCIVCGAPVTRHRKDNRLRRNGQDQTLVFCNHVCQGRWLGTNHGWGVTKRRGVK